MNDDALRPDEWDDYIGQHRLKAELQTQIDAARMDDRVMRHLLLTAPAGTGKTTLAKLIADRLNEDFLRLVMPVSSRTLERALEDHFGVLLLDELHACSRSEQERLLTVIEDNYYQKDNGRRIENDGLTIIGATTDAQKIIKPLWDRFEAKGGVPCYEPYGDEECALIVLGMARRLKVDLTEEAAAVYGRAAAGTPRLAAKFVHRHSELATTLGRTPDAGETLAHLRMTTDGLTANHQRYLRILSDLGGTKGVATICKLLQLPLAVVEDLEILLVTRDYIEFTTAGRELTSKGARFLRPERKKAA